MKQTTKSAPTCLADHLKETYKLTELFRKSNLHKLLEEGINDGSLYTPPINYEVGSVSITKLGLCNGGDHYSFDFTVYLELNNGDEDLEEYKTARLWLTPPVALIGSYIHTTEYPYIYNPDLAREKMEFNYKLTDVRAWIKQKSTEMKSTRLKEALKERETLEAEIKKLNKALPKQK